MVINNFQTTKILAWTKALENYYTRKETVGRPQTLDSFLYNGLSTIRISRLKSKFAHLERHLSKTSLKEKF